MSERKGNSLVSSLVGRAASTTIIGGCAATAGSLVASGHIKEAFVAIASSGAFAFFDTLAYHRKTDTGGDNNPAAQKLWRLNLTLIAAGAFGGLTLQNNRESTVGIHDEVKQEDHQPQRHASHLYTTAEISPV